jgi:transposase
MSRPLPRDQDSEAERSEVRQLGSEGRCDNCGGRLDLLVRVEPQTNGQPVTYYACDRCDQVLVRKR